MAGMYLFLGGHKHGTIETLTKPPMIYSAAVLMDAGPPKFLQGDKGPTISWNREMKQEIYELRRVVLFGPQMWVYVKADLPQAEWSALIFEWVASSLAKTMIESQRGAH